MSDSQYIRFPLRSCALQQALANNSMTQELSACTVPVSSPEVCEQLILAGKTLMWMGYHPYWAAYRNADGLSLLHIAAARDDVSNVIYLTRQIGPDPRDREGRTPLHLAARYSNAQVVFSLIDDGADVNAYDRRRETPIFYAVRACNAEALETLLRHRAAPRARNAEGKTAEDYIEEGADNLKKIFERYK